PVNAAAQTCIDFESSPGRVSTRVSPGCSKACGPAPTQLSSGRFRAAIASPSRMGPCPPLRTSTRTLFFTFAAVADNPAAVLRSASGGTASAFNVALCPVPFAPPPWSVHVTSISAPGTTFPASIHAGSSASGCTIWRNSQEACDPPLPLLHEPSGGPKLTGPTPHALSPSVGSRKSALGGSPGQGNR